MKNSKRSRHGSRKGGPNSPASPASLPLTDADRESLEELLRRLGVKAWDVLLVGDGSGSNWDGQAGWASVSVERVTMERLVHYGCVSRGTVNFAEMMAYLQPLDWLSGREADRRREGRSPIRAYQVHIVTDSEYCRSTGTLGGRLVTKNAGVWSAFDAYARHGFVLTWHHLKRESCALNGYCDKISKLARKLAKDYNLQERAAELGIEPRTVYEINPAEEG